MKTSFGGTFHAETKNKKKYFKALKVN